MNISLRIRLCSLRWRRTNNFRDHSQHYEWNNHRRCNESIDSLLSFLLETLDHRLPLIVLVLPTQGSHTSQEKHVLILPQLSRLAARSSAGEMVVLALGRGNSHIILFPQQAVTWLVRPDFGFINPVMRVLVYRRVGDCMGHFAVVCDGAEDQEAQGDRPGEEN